MGVMVLIWREIHISTQKRAQFLNITGAVSSEVAKSGIRNGYCIIYIPHSTAGITINENTDPNVTEDLINILERLVPRESSYQHAEGNSDSHFKASLVGSSCMVPVIDGRLALGAWQAIYFCEFDGPRQRKYKVGLTGDR